MESNWRASEDAWSRVPFVRGLGWTPFRMGDAAGGILLEDVILIRTLCVCVYMARYNRAVFVRVCSSEKRKEKKKTEDG